MDEELDEELLPNLARVSRKLADGSRLYAGRGTGRTCTLCRSSIGSREVEYEIRQPNDAAAQPQPELRFHMWCYEAWQQVGEAGRG
jgi:hypothetical protein